MKRIKSVFTKIKNFNDEMMLNNEKITILNRNRVLIQNYGEILEINDEVIKLTKLKITGKNLKLAMISKYFLELNGYIYHVDFGDHNE